MADGLIFGFDGKYKVHSLFAVPDSQLKFNPNPIKGLLVAMLPKALILMLLLLVIVFL